MRRGRRASPSTPTSVRHCTSGEAVCSGHGYTVHVDGLVVRALGAWHPWNDRLLALLRISSGYAGLMRQLIVSETVAWSRDMYVEQITEARQYRLPDAGDLHPEDLVARESRSLSGGNDVDGATDRI